MLQTCFRKNWRKATILIAGSFLGLFCMSNGALAINGYTYVAACTTACAATSDFQAAALYQANQQTQLGTYMVVSTTTAKTALMKVTGRFQLSGPIGAPGSHLVLVNGVATPLDESGNSLAGQTEDQLQTYYHYFDQTTFGWDRGSKIGNVNVPPSYQESFVCNCDLNEMGTQVPMWITDQYNLGKMETLPVGTIVTLVFADGSTAQFAKKDPYSSYRWGWNGKAWNSKHQPIDQYGNVKTNPFSTGSGPGGGIGSVVGFVSQGVMFGFLDSGACYTTTTVTYEGAVIYSGGHFLAC